MKRILILGAGLSASSMIKYLLDAGSVHDWKVTVGDLSTETAQKKVNGHPNGEAVRFDVNDERIKEDEIRKADVVISFLPARFHPIIAKECLKQGKNMVTASYVSDEMKAMDEEVKAKGLTFLNELGVDPGIDHMSAMVVIDKIKEQGGKLLSFKSATGGLVAPKYDNNPWNYKFTWNPRNVVLAGQGVSKFIRNGQYKYIPYNQLFKRIQRTNVLDVGEFEVYPNRDSLKYREIYGLEDIPTIFRGTMRRPGYCKSWNVFVQLGCTDDSYLIENTEEMSYREFLNSFLKYEENKSVERKVMEHLKVEEDSSIMYKLRWLGMFSDEKIGIKEATPAQVLQHCLEKKWALDPDDKDMIVMQHQFEYEVNGEQKGLTSSMVVIGKDTVDTAMSITVGIPVAIATKLLLTGVINTTGVKTPVSKDIYEPILKELEDYGIKFVEQDIEGTRWV